MARRTKPSGNANLKTGNNFIDKAREAGAKVHPVDGRGFQKIETPSGSMYITPGNQPLDPRTRKNYRHWFRLLGLLGVLLAVIDYLWGVLQLPPIM